MPIASNLHDALPKEVVSTLKNLDDDFNGGDITKKGYLKKKAVLIKPFLKSADLKTVHALEKQLKEEDISEVSYFKALADILDGIEHEVKKVNGAMEVCEDDSDKENNPPIDNNKVHENGITNECEDRKMDIIENNPAKELKEVIKNGEDVSISPQKKLEKGSPLVERKSEEKRKKLDTVEHESELEETGIEIADPDESMNETMETSDNEDVIKKPKQKKKSKSKKDKQSEESTEETPGTSEGSNSKKKQSKPSSSQKSLKSPLTAQKSIKSFFSSVPTKRKLSEDKKDASNDGDNAVLEPEDKKIKTEANISNCVEESVDCEPNDKKFKTDEDKSNCDEEKGTIDSDNKELKAEEDGSKADIKPIKKNAEPSIRCSDCRQMLDDPELKIYPGDPPEALEEFIMLTDPKLSLFTGDEENFNSDDERPQHKITQFCVYDRHGHLCSFDAGLIEKNKELFFSGYVKPIYEDNPDTEGGVPSCKMGPINEWWTTGFDGGENALIGFSTAFADYFLMVPHDAYTPIFDTLKEKIHLSKIVLEFLIKDMEATYEDLLNCIEVAVPPQGLSSFTEDNLLRHAQWIIDQIESYDEAADDDEILLVTNPCVRALIKLAGVTLGKRRAMRKEQSKKKVIKKPAFTMATVTPLVKSIFDECFASQIDDVQCTTERKRRCEKCDNCLMPDCGKCKACKDMVKYGGSGKAKQSCHQRRCPNMAVKEADEDDGLDESIQVPETVKSKHDFFKKESGKFRKQKNKLKWIGDPIDTLKKKTFYSSIEFNEDVLSCGDYVTVMPDDDDVPLYVAKISYMWENRDGEKMIHASWFYRSIDTVLGEVGDPLELFLCDECQDTQLSYCVSKVKVTHKPVLADWKSIGGIEDFNSDKVIEVDDGKSFFYQKWYDSTFWRFEDIPEKTSDCEDVSVKHCDACIRAKATEMKETPVLENEVNKTSSNIEYGILKYEGEVLQKGDSFYMVPNTFDFIAKPIKTTVAKADKSRLEDDELYPELYRKSDYVKGSNDQVPDPYQIGLILKISTKSDAPSELESKGVKIHIRKFYRPENTHKGKQATKQADLNLLYISDEETTVKLSSFQGKCQVTYGEDIESLENYFQSGENKFYFNEKYDAEKKEFLIPEDEELELFKRKKGKGKGKGKGKSSTQAPSSTKVEDEVNIDKLNCLDIFAGCGGLSEGFHQAGIADSKWAIEIMDPAAQAYRLNNPHCTVFNDDCNMLLRLAMDGEEKTNKGQKLPKKGEVDLLCGGPPCQGFSGMNRFNSREYSQFKNSLIASYISYCDYYRPRFFLLENVRNFVSFKKSVILKLALRCLLRMGYQCAFGILQAGQYGVPQTRRRLIILAAAPGEKLPIFPEPTHTFSPRGVQLFAVIDDKRFEGAVTRLESAPLRTVTVGDALSDLPDIKNGANKDEMSYSNDVQSHFQKLIRGKQFQPILRDHVCKDMNPLVHARMQHIPLVPGSDWRDLPNSCVRLSDGTTSKKLRYIHSDKKMGKSKSGYKRGVCACATGQQCEPSDRQFSTLIPWCLPHTGNRHNHWSGLYGRLEWDGFFSTTVTNPEPMGKQGRVLHPEQHRVVSVRECARSQGFPDTYRFHGSKLDRHRQIGNAVPPPMAKAIGLEIKKCLVWKSNKS